MSAAALFQPLIERAPAPLRRLAWKLAEYPSRRAFRRELAARPLAVPKGRPALHYGDEPVAAGRIVHGGRVKLRHLHADFPPTDPFNLLYLVSSARPPHAGELVRWARARGAKFVLNQNGVATPSWAGTGYQSFNEPMRELLRQADHVFYQSEFCKESADRFLGEPSCPWEIAFNCVDTEKFTPGPPLAPGPWRLLAAGTHEQSYRVLVAIDALGELVRQGCDAVLTIAGRMTFPKAEREAADRVARLGLEKWVTFQPAFTQEEAPALFHAAHLLLHLKFNDPCPTVVIEALASGVPVIGSRSGGMPELVPRAGGLLIDVPRSYEREHWPNGAEVAAAIRAVMEDHSAAAKNARSCAVDRFGSAQWVAQHRQVFEDLTR